MKRKRKCRKCRDLFLPDSRSYRPTTNGRKVSTQHYCSKPECQQESHRKSNRTYWMSDAEFRQRNVVAVRAWRKKNKRYWQQRRARDVDYTRRNRELQRRRDAKLRGNLANMDTIESLRRDKLKRIGILIHLANTDSIRVPWTLVSEEIWLFMRWSERLANTNSIARHVIDNRQSLP